MWLWDCRGEDVVDAEHCFYVEMPQASGYTAKGYAQEVVAVEGWRNGWRIAVLILGYQARIGQFGNGYLIFSRLQTFVDVCVLSARLRLFQSSEALVTMLTT